jgi:hypothetical protein
MLILEFHMSMNLHLSGKREVTVKKTGKSSEQNISFDLWQTPTSVTNDACNSSNPKDSYVSWASKFDKDEQEPIYADGDIFCEQEPIGHEIRNDFKSHIKELEEWLVMCEEEGYEVEFYSL